MEIEKCKLDKLINIVELIYGKRVNTPKDFYCLSVDIITKTGASISVSSLKRLWGYVKSSHMPSKHTLNIISLFANFRDIDDFINFCNNSDNLNGASNFFDLKMIRVEQLQVGESY